MLVSKIEKGCSTSACAAVCDVCGEELEFYGVWMGCRVLNISELQLPVDLNSDSESVFCNCKRPVLLSKFEKVVVTIAVTFVAETLLEVDGPPTLCRRCHQLILGQQTGRTVSQLQGLRAAALCLIPD